MTNTLTIKFRAKRNEWPSGNAYKVPQMQSHHLEVAHYCTASQIFLTGLGNHDITNHRLKNLLGGFLPSYVWDNPELNDGQEWTIKPIGKGFMADVSITVPINGKAIRGKREDSKHVTN